MEWDEIRGGRAKARKEGAGREGDGMKAREKERREEELPSGKRANE